MLAVTTDPQEEILLPLAVTPKSYRPQLKITSAILLLWTVPVHDILFYSVFGFWLHPLVAWINTTPTVLTSIAVLVFWLVLCVNLIQAGVITEKRASVEEMPPMRSLLVIKGGGPSPLWVVPTLGTPRTGTQAELEPGGRS